MRFLGIDFSGSAGQWSAGCRRPTVWISTVSEPETGRFQLHDLVPVQALPGSGTPFDRFCAMLRAGDFAAASIDAPFSVPAAFLPSGGHAALLRDVAALPIETGRPFPRGGALLDLLRASGPDTTLRDAPRGIKHYRDTERGRGVNVRPTLWNGPRGGAPFTVACLLALARADRPIWPWRSGPGMLAEAFPTAQLLHWNLPSSRYGLDHQTATRADILAGLEPFLHIENGHRSLMLEHPDALDAVLAAFGAVAAMREGVIADPPADGRIALMA